MINLWDDGYNLYVSKGLIVYFPYQLFNIIVIKHSKIALQKKLHPWSDKGSSYYFTSPVCRRGAPRPARGTCWATNENEHSVLINGCLPKV